MVSFKTYSIDVANDEMISIRLRFNVNVTCNLLITPSLTQLRSRGREHWSFRFRLFFKVFFLFFVFFLHCTLLVLWAWFLVFQSAFLFPSFLFHKYKIDKLKRLSETFRGEPLVSCMVGCCRQNKCAAIEYQAFYQVLGHRVDQISA